MNRITSVGRQPPTFGVARHAHPDWELIFCLTGSGELVFDGGVLPYTANEIAVIPPNLPHANRSGAGFTNIHLTMADMPLDAAEPEIIPADGNGFLRNAFFAALYYAGGTFAGSAFLLPLYGQLIATSLTVRQPHRLRSDIVSHIETNILQNYADSAYDLNAYLRELPFNAEYLKKLFKKETGRTPLQFLTDTRLKSAAGSLALYENRENISEVARLCGFANPLYFSRLFKKKYGVSPREYRANIPPAPTEPKA